MDSTTLLIHATAGASFVLYALALAWWLRRTTATTVLNALWTAAFLLMLIHVLLAFHFTHGWSHRHAFETTRRESGFGEGLYVNDLFMALWTFDVAWWWLRPRRYATRAVWIDRALHLFMLFIAFNATVVFESGAGRMAGAVASALLLGAWLFKRRAGAVGDGSDEPRRELE